MSQTTAEDCTRKKVVINGENFYLIVGKEFIMCTIPRENDPNQSEVRSIVEQVCNAVSEVMSGGKYDNSRSN
jgi:hypothetical protein